MSVQTAMAPEIVLKSNEDDFEKAIKSMTLRELMQGVSSLQKEMAKEQENFNGLTNDLQVISKSSRQYKQISKDMITSQNRLTDLMNRSMKCFAQQALVKADEKENTVPRSNSFKESPAKIHPTKPPVPVQRSMSARFPQDEIMANNSFSVKPVTPTTQKVNKTNEIQTPSTPEFLKVKLRPSSGQTMSEEKKLSRRSDSYMTNKNHARNVVTFNNINLSSNVRPVAKITPNNSRANELTDNELKNNIINDQKDTVVEKRIIDGEKTGKKYVTTEVTLEPSLVPQNRRYSSALEQSTRNKLEFGRLSQFIKSEEAPESGSPQNKLVNVNRIKPLRVSAESSSRNSGSLDLNTSPSVKNVALRFSTPVNGSNQEMVKKDQEEYVALKNISELEQQPVVSNTTQITEDKNTEKDDVDSSVAESDDEIPPELLDEEECIQPQHWEAMRMWDPTKLLKALYHVTLIPDLAEDISHQFVTMEGYMEKLPQGKKKATLLKTWKRRFFRAKDGWLHYFDTNSRDKPSDSMQLMGGKIEDLGTRMLGIDDGRGRYIMVRCPTETEHGQWKIALESQTADNTKSTYIKPVLNSPQNHSKKVVIIDLGSHAIRAGILGEQPSLPQLFYPSMLSINQKTGERTFGFDAYKPDHRLGCDLEPPVRPTNKTEKFNINLDLIPDVFTKIFTDLNVDSKRYWVMLSTPQNLNDTLKQKLMDIFMEQFKVLGVCMVAQSLLSLYSYNTTSGIIVDIGERMEIMPIYDGMLIEGGITRQSYGGKKIQDSLLQSLMADNYRLQLPIEQLIVKYVMEKSCFVVENYHRCLNDPVKLKSVIPLQGFDLPEGTYTEMSHDISCYKSPEGLFNTDLWEMDYKNLPKLVYKAIQESPMDSRRHMYRSIYLSGGVTMLPGFADRLHSDLAKLAPPSVVIQIHASPQRYHAAYIGACSVAAMPIFEHTCITAKEWKDQGVKAFRKWATNS